MNQINVSMKRSDMEKSGFETLVYVTGVESSIERADLIRTTLCAIISR